MENINNLLLEGSRDNLLQPYLNILLSKGINMSLSQFKQLLLAKFVNEGAFNALSLGSNFYLAGVARYYFEGLLTTNKRLGIFSNKADKFNSSICQRLNALIIILRNAYIDTVGQTWEQPEDFGELSLDKLLKKYNKQIDAELGINNKNVEIEKKEKISLSTKVGHNYEYEIIYNYEQCKKYYPYTSPGAWCITYGKQHYDAYIKRLNIHYVIFKRKGFENIPRVKGKNWSQQKPQDEYGNSLIAVLQDNINGKPIYITSRWNHGTYEDNTRCMADYAYTTEEFLKVIGDDGSVFQRCFKQWKQNKTKTNAVDKAALKKEKLETLRYFKYIQMKINGGENPSNFFNDYKYLDDTEHTNPWKSIVIAQTKINDTFYSCLIDRKHIVFETICENSLRHQFNRVFYNILYLPILNSDFILYDLKRHNLINIEGTCKFKYINQRYGTCPYIIVSLTQNQQALIDTKEAKVVKTPRGASWLEDISLTLKKTSHYRREVELMRDINENSIITLIYDSASDEKYIYYTKTKQFIDNELKQVCDNKWTIKSLINLPSHVTLSDGDRLKYYNVSTHRFLNFQGYDEFRGLKKIKDVIAFEPYGSGRVFFYNVKLNKHIELNGRLIVGNGNNQWKHLGLERDFRNSDSDMYYLSTNYQREDNRDYVYIAPIDYFYHDDISGYLFKVFGHNGKMFRDPSQVISLKNISDKDIYQIPTAQEIIKKVSQNKQEIQEQFNNILNKINKS